MHGPLAIISAEGTPLDALENALFVLEALAADNSSRSSLQLAGTGPSGGKAS